MNVLDGGFREYSTSDLKKKVSELRNQINGGGFTASDLTFYQAGTRELYERGWDIGEGKGKKWVRHHVDPSKPIYPFR